MRSVCKFVKINHVGTGTRIPLAERVADLELKVSPV